jgi:peptide/nickel transport system ATP-binding protein
MSGVVEIVDLAISYRSDDGAVCAVDGVDLSLAAGESLGIVGESGSGKSTLGMAIGRLLAPNARFERGDIRVEGRSVRDCSAAELRAMRRDRLGFVYQNPMSALDPTMRVGRQIALTLGGRAESAAIEALLGRVGLDEAARVAASFPHELSGGMAQRVVIALAIARHPAVLIADEPTASLDASIQGVILDLLTSLRAAAGSSLIVMSHDLRMVAHRCERIAVMYAGRVIEAGASRAVFADPRHPYTRALIAAIPDPFHLVAASATAKARGEIASALNPPPGCHFNPRCPMKADRCVREDPPLEAVSAGHRAACHFRDRVG